MRVLVLAQGQGRRWDQPDGPYLGVPKHLISIEGETLLDRQVRLFAGRGCEVVVVAPDDPRYRRHRARVVTLDEPAPTGTNMDKFLATAALWSTTDRTVLVWGDCFLTDELADVIVAHDSDQYHVWRRPAGSKVTGARWDESFAVSFGAGEHRKVLDRARYLVDAVRNGRLVHPRAPGMDPTHIRTHLAAMAGAPDHLLDSNRNTNLLPMQTHWDDWSDDFDNPWEWAGWIGRRTAGTRRVGVCIPWAPDEAWREMSHRWCTEFWRSLDLPVFEAADPTGNTNRSAMRNAAADQAIAAGCEVLVFADADTFAPAAQIWAAVHLAAEREQLVLAFTEYTRATRDATEMIRRASPDEVGRRFIKQVLEFGGETRMTHASGLVVVPVDLFERVGGFDTRFVRWGFEDRAFWLACNTFAGVAPRIHGPAVHWWHPPAGDKDREHPAHVEAAALARRYYVAAAWVPDVGAVQQAIAMGQIPPIDLAEDAAPDPEAMRQLLAEPGGPLAARQPVPA